jgi:uncharacterized membrane protein
LGVWRARGPVIAVLLMSLGFAVLFSWLAVARNLSYQSHAFDLGNMDQALWNTVHGRTLRFTDMQVGPRVLTSRFAIHVEPILVPLSLLYVVWADPRIILIVQACVVACGALPLYLLARDLLRRPLLALVVPVGYLAHPSLQNAVLDDFHAVALSAAFLAWAIFFVYRENLAGFTIAAVLSAATKEEVGLTVAGLGVWLALKGRRRAGATAVFLGVAWFLICLQVIVPHFNPAGRSPYLARYGYLGHGLISIVGGLLTDPARALDALVRPDRQAYLLYLLHPLGLLPLAGAPMLLVALPVLAINMLSADPTMYSGYYQYSVELVPVVVAATAFGLCFFDRLATRIRSTMAGPVLPTLCLLVLAGAAYDCWRWGFTPLSLGYAVPSSGAHQAAEDRALSLIPRGSPVAAADEMEPHLSHRTWIYLLPTVHPSNGPAADDIVLDASIPGAPVGPAQLHRVVVHAMSHGYGVRFADNGALLLHRGSASQRIPRRFYSFALGDSSTATPARVTWGTLTLVGYVVHPANRIVNRARPAISVETYWRVTGPLNHVPRMEVRVGPASGIREPISHWASATDSPALDWLPPRLWNAGQIVHVAFVAIVPPLTDRGSVPVALRLPGRRVTASNLRRAGDAGDSVFLGTVQVEP